MTAHDRINKSEVLGKVSPEFKELTQDLNEILSHSNDPALVAGMLYAVAEERRKSNELFARMADKIDLLMLQLKTGKVEESAPKQYSLLSEQDQTILNFVEQNGFATAKDVQNLMHYKGSNAASQRLNTLYKQGLVKKVQSGKKVAFTVHAGQHLPL